MKKSKRYQEALSTVDGEKNYTLSEALTLLKSQPSPKFDESVDVVLRLGVDPRQADQAIRGSFSLPNGLGKTIRVIAFVDEARVEAAKAAGAIEAGGQELADKIKNENWSDFDVAIAEPKMMRVVGQLGRVLGPKGLMPSPKAGTVVADPVKAVEEFVSGRQEYKNDAGGNVHFSVGRKSFDAVKLEENLNSFLRHIQAIKPASVRGVYLKGVSVSSTMGPGIRVAL